MSLSRALEVKPLLIAAAIGAVGYALLRRKGLSDFALGAGLGVAVQLGVRLLGVS
jgi:hypothetical protein